MIKIIMSVIITSNSIFLLSGWEISSSSWQLKIEKEFLSFLKERLIIHWLYDNLLESQREVMECNLLNPLLAKSLTYFIQLSLVFL